MVDIKFKVKTGVLEKNLNELNLNEMTATELEEFIKQNIEVCLLKDSKGNDIFHVFLNEKEPGEDIVSNLNKWTELITELSDKEVELISLKEEYAQKEFEIVFMRDIDFKGLYGSTAEKVRKQHASNELKPLKDKINDLELSIDYLKRRITFLKDLIRTKRTLMEIKE